MRKEFNILFAEQKNNHRLYEIEFGSQIYKYYLYTFIDEEYITHISEIEDAESFFIICDKNIEQIYGQKLLRTIGRYYKCNLISFECEERNKNLKILEELIERVLEKKATRRTCIIALGGGICGNMAGMVAALLFRGIKFIHIPTSLMAVLDSVLSLKQAINSGRGKNLIGTFYRPEMVISSMDFLITLPEREIVSGLCEVVKNSLTILPDSIDGIFDTLNKNSDYSKEDYLYFVDLSIKAKTHVMRDDPYEKHDALILEYGHTIGHAIELSTNGAITHGEAVGLGMLCAAEISRELGYLSKDDVELHKVLLEKAGAPVKIPGYLKPEAILSIMKFDNKRGYLSSQKGIFHMVLLEKIGKPLFNGEKILTPVPEDLARHAISKLY
ncbi:3-dehydroquinate synthase [Anaerobacterium chartisolvens]|uniref:3-dehydroquinate synthase n=1 Tax=Anaerobacterium chartisolvens TaxID=1297424 RepID=A0A369AUJ7_9FIRM|nr:2-deoxy-scyllo-inosose synthase [Anaerobacterium chartisolvens]RCX11134.1 3-dehydroquinate synthase [Anaerobacterium chartisolvens]